MYLRGRIWWTTLTHRNGTARRVSLETTDRATARKVEQWAQDVLDTYDRLGVIAAVIADELTIIEAFTSGEETAARLLAERRDPLLTDSLLDAWEASLVRDRGTTPKTAAYYRHCVEETWPAPRVASWLTPHTIQRAIGARDVSNSTKNRIKAAFQVLCRWLVAERMLERSPMPDVESWSNAAPRTLHYDDAEAWRVITAMPTAASRALSGIMWAAGWELAACINARVRDFDLPALKAFARGTKADSRTRWTVIMRPEVLPLLEAQLAGKGPDDLVWPGLATQSPVHLHRRVIRDIKAVPMTLDGPCAPGTMTTLHDWRHSFAIRELRAGRGSRFVAQMLGHGTDRMVLSCYGKYVLHARDLDGIVGQVMASHGLVQGVTPIHAQTPHNAAPAAPADTTQVATAQALGV